MKPDSKYWIVMGEPATPAEAAALDAFRELLPEDGITTAWANLTFIDDNGRSAEIDVLLLTPSGFHVVELKGWHRSITGTAQRWLHAGRNVENPWLVTDRKAKRLSSLLKAHAPGKRSVPFMTACVVLHGDNCIVELDERGRTGVYVLDGYDVKAKPALPTLSDFLKRHPSDSRNRIDLVRARAIRTACDRVGFRPTPKVRMVGDFQVDDSTPIAEGPDWQDVVVTLPGLEKVKRRLRLYDIPPKASAGERQRIEQLAKREFQLTYGVKHDGIATPLDFKTTDDGPALVFEYDATEMPLEAYLAEPGAELGIEARVELIFRLGEILRHAHNRHLIHRALAPARVWLTPRSDPAKPGMAIRDWYFGQKDRTSGASTRWTNVTSGATDLMAIATHEDWLYLAPEARGSAQNLPGVPLDVYGFGALSYLIFTGNPPASTFAELEQMQSASKALDPRTASPGMPDSIADVVAMATSVDESERPSMIDEVLDLLRTEWNNLRRPEGETAEPTTVDDPLDAQKGDIIADRFVVDERRGEGASGVALAVNDTETDDPDRAVILKVARTESAERKLRAEADVLRALDHRRIVRLLEGPIEVDERSALLMSDAGKETLASRLATEGRSTLGQLETFGGELLEAMAYLESRGVFHRDIKPSNLGITPDPGTRKPSLVLFDFSLAGESVEAITSGTAGYLDPFLGRGRRRVYDRAAELYAVSATLFEMATGQLPWWGEGAGQPASATDAPVIESTSFEPAVAAQLTQLFKRALSPDYKERFGSANELAVAWQDVFSSLDVSDETADASDTLAGQATKETSLAQSGLSARAVSAVSRLDVATVGDLLGVHPVRINTIRGLGEKYRKEIQARIRQWRLRLGETEAAAEDQSLGIERLVQGLVGKLKGSERTIAKAVLGRDGPDETPLAWPTATEVAKAMDVSRDRVTAALDDAVTAWSKGRDRVLDQVRSEVAEMLAHDGRVKTVAEVVAALIAQRGSLLEGPGRTREGSTLLRAVYELDVRHSEPFFELRRRTGARADLLMLRETADPDETAGEFPAPDLLAETVIDLGKEADELASGGVLPHARAVEELRGFMTANQLTELRILDHRLVRLAAAASENAAVSGFGELYPVDLDPQEAVAHALRGKPGRRINEVAVRKSVAARFPEVRLPESTRQLDDLVASVLPGVVNRGGVYELASTRHSTAGASSYTIFAPTALHEAAERLRESLRRNSGLTICAPPKRYIKATTALRAAFDIDVLDVAELAVTSAKELSAQYGVEWQFVLGVDAGPKDTSDWANLARLVQESVTPQWEQRLDADRPILITNAGPLVRYGMSHLLANLLDVSTPKPAARWLLVAMHGDQPVPRLEGAPVPLGPSGWIGLPSDLSGMTLESAKMPAPQTPGERR